MEINQQNITLQYITDGSTAEATHRQVMAALDGGCRWIQIRMKSAQPDEICAAMKLCVDECHRRGAVLIINDHAELVGVSGADGVHIGQNDMPVEEARRLVGRDKIIGLTVNNELHARNAAGKPIDYIGLGPWRFTTTKRNLSAVLGREGVAQLIARVRASGITVPIVTIGGITVSDVAEALSVADGIAVSGAISHAADPAQATRQFVETINALK